MRLNHNSHHNDHYALEARTIRVLLAGNPNSGKTSIFNALTGSRRRVGNYPGVTVEKRQGRFRLDGQLFDVTDLPGTYSLTSYSPEERIAQEEIVNSDRRVVVVVVDSTTLKRSMVLLTQIIQTGANPILCLNMADEARDAGQVLDVDHLSKLLGFPVVETVGHKGEGVDRLKEAILSAVRNPVRKSRLRLGERLSSALDSIRAALPQDVFSETSRTWVANKLLVDDPVYVERVRAAGADGSAAIDVASQERARLESETGLDVSLFVTECQYGFVDGLLKEVTQQNPRENAREVSDSIDRVLANRVLGVPIFLAVMYVIFWLTFSVGEAPMGWIERGFSALGNGIGSLWPEGVQSPIRSLLLDGIIGGVGGVLVFLPNIVLLFLGLAILEDTGYLARAAFLVDQLMHRFGLHGRSFIPLLTGFGCSIPGIMATRTLENERDRLATMLVLPLMSCGARLPIWMLLIPAFFAPSLRAPILWSIYLVGIVLALILALLLRRTLLKGDEAPFVMELPPYRLPTFRAIIRKMTARSWLYLRKAGTIILGISILMWFITSYPKPKSYDVDRSVAAGAEVLTPNRIEQRRLAEDLNYSIAGRTGKALEVVIRPLGFDWKIGTAMIGAFAAKEVFVAQMGIVYSLGETSEESESLRQTLSRDYSPLVGISLMLFLLISAPCMATMAVTRRESGSWKWAFLQFGGLTALAYLISLLVYQVGMLFI
jgi:ferrous iron transport protein B